MLKQPASGVLASFRPSTYQTRFSEVGSAGGAFPFAKIHSRGERPTRSAVCTSSALHSLWPCWTACLIILREPFLLFHACHNSFPWPANVLALGVTDQLRLTR